MALFKFEDNSKYIMALMQNRKFLFGQYMASDIKRRAISITPNKYGNLHTQIYVKGYGETTSITWRMPYAAYQERGMRADGTHVVRNYTTPGTGPHFAQQSVHETLTEFGDLWKRTQIAIPAKRT